MTNIKNAIKNKAVERLLGAMELESAARAKAKIITELMGTLDKEIKYGTLNPENFRQDLKHLKDQEDKNLKSYADETLRALGAMEIETTIEAMNIKTPSLIAQLIEKDNDVRTTIGEDGKISIMIEDKKGLSGDTLANHITKMKKDPTTAFLFVENHQARKDHRQEGIINPWKKESLNLTEQGRIHLQNPELAARMKKEAGIM